MNDRAKFWLYAVIFVVCLSGAYGAGWWVGSGLSGHSAEIDRLRAEIAAARDAAAGAQHETWAAQRIVESQRRELEELAAQLAGTVQAIDSLAERITGSAEAAGSVGAGIAEDLATLGDCIRAVAEITGINLEVRRRSEALRTAIGSMAGADCD